MSTIAEDLARLEEIVRRLEADDVVITGGLTAAHPLLPGGVVSAVFAPGPPGRDVRVGATLDR